MVRCFAYTSIKEVSFYVSNKGVTGYILMTSNSSVNLLEIIPKSCRFYKLVSVVPLKIINNTIILNSTESFIIEFQCSPRKLENGDYYLNIYSSSDIYKGSSLFIYLLDNIKLINLTPRFSIYNSTIYNNNITNLKFSLVYRIYSEETSNTSTEASWYLFIILLINLVYVVIILYVLKILARRFRKTSKENREKLLSMCNTKLEREIMNFILKNNGQCYQYEISKKLNIDKSTVSKILKRLEERNLIVREDGDNGILVKINPEFNH